MSIINIAHENMIEILKLFKTESENLKINTKKLDTSDINFLDNLSFLNGQMDILNKFSKIINNVDKQIHPNETL